jgi:MFS family permease
MNLRGSSEVIQEVYLSYQNKQLSAESPKPRLFYGYIIVALSVLVIAMIFGINFSFGVFFNPLIDEFGWHRSVTSLAYALMNVVGGFIGIFGGRISDKFGVKVVSLYCGISMGIGMILMSTISSLWQVYLIYGLLVGAGISSSWNALNSTVARWFLVRRGLMISIVTMGIGLGTITIPYLASWLIPQYGWRMAYIVIGALTITVVTVASLFLKSDPSDMGLAPYGANGQTNPVSVSMRGFSYIKDTILSRNFLLLCAIYFCHGVAMHSIMVHIVPHATGLGIATVTAASILSILGAINIAGRLLMGTSSDKLGIKKSLVIGLGLTAISILWLLVAKDIWALYLFSIVFGFAYGGLQAFMGIAPAELFGVTSLGTILGVIAFVYTSGAAIGPVFAGYIHDVTGSYYIAFFVAALMAILGCALTFLMKTPKKK